MQRDNVLPFLLQNALNKANPSGLPSNLVIQQFGAPTDDLNLYDDVRATVSTPGYPYGWGERIPVTLSSGSWSASLTEPAALAWLIRMSAYIPSGSTVTLSAAVGGGASQPLTPMSPAVASFYADDLYPWRAAAFLGPVGIAPFGTPSGWPDASAWWIGPDTTALTGDPPSKWLLRKWVLVTVPNTYTVSLSAQSAATVYLNGVEFVQTIDPQKTAFVSPGQIITNATVKSMAQGSVTLSAGYHLITVEAMIYGLSSAPSGVLLSVADPSGNILENGSGHDWETSGFVDAPWSYNSQGPPLFYHQWYGIRLPESTSVAVGLTAAGIPILCDLWWYSVGAWKWGADGRYDATANETLPIQQTTTEIVG